MYTGCSCAVEAAKQLLQENKPVDGDPFGPIPANWTQASKGYCVDDVCKNFVYYLALLSIIKVVASTARVGNLMITVRY
jgi:hypothetical protein